MAKKPTPLPPSDYYAVEISRVWPDHGFDYKPGTSITVDHATLVRMQAEAALVISAQPV